jgi:hypothetical protein
MRVGMRKIWMMGMIVFLLVGCSVKQPPLEDEIPDEEEIIEEVDEEVVEKDFLRSYLTGVQVESQAVTAVMVMIENSAAARPHSGISEADVVYEVAMEKYSTTRFLAIFSSVLPKKVGPVRSARIPFVKLAQQWMLPYAHYGAAKSGEGDAYSIIKSLRWPIRFDGVAGLNDNWFARDSKRKSPHNAYFNAFEAASKIPSVSLTGGFAFSEKISGEVDAKSLTLDIVSSVKVTYTYDESSVKYLRFINGKPMMDENNDKHVAVSNIIVLIAPHTMVTSTQYVLVDFNVGGKIKVFSGGRMTEGTWAFRGGRIQYFDIAANDMVLLPGNTWIQVVSPQMKVTYE